MMLGYWMPTSPAQCLALGAVKANDARSSKAWVGNFALSGTSAHLDK